MGGGLRETSLVPAGIAFLRVSGHTPDVFVATAQPQLDLH